MKVLFTYDRMESTVEMTLPIIKKILLEHRMEMNTIQASGITSADIKKCDVIFYVRPQSALSRELIKICRKYSRIIISLYDDDFLSLKDYKIRRKIQYDSVLQNIKNSDYIFTGNGNIAKQYCKINDRVKIARIDTVVTDLELANRRKFEDKKQLKIVYYDNQGQTQNFAKIIGNVIKTMDCHEREEIDWTFIHVKPELDGINADKIHYISKMLLTDFKSFLRENEFDVGIAPLEDNTFNSCKYINKYIEYTTAEIPGIYSRTEPYLGSIQSDIDGVLCKDNPYDWIAAFKKMKSGKYRENLIQNAKKNLQAHYSYEAISNRMIEECPDLIQYTAAHNVAIKGLGIAKVKAAILNIYDYFRRIFIRLKLDGVKSIFVLVWNVYIMKKDYNDVFHNRREIE